MRISDWSSDVCSSDLLDYFENSRRAVIAQRAYAIANPGQWTGYGPNVWGLTASNGPGGIIVEGHGKREVRSEEHTSELQSLMRISYAVFCLKTKTPANNIPTSQNTSYQQPTSQ